MRLTNARLDGSATVDVTIRDGVIDLVTPAAPGTRQPGDVDLGGHLLLPALVDGHIHLDKTLLGSPWQPHQPDGTVRGRIEAEKAILRAAPEPMPVRAERLIRHVVARGTTAMRCHVDIDTEVGTRGLEALLELRERVSQMVDITFVAFPQSGLISNPGAEALMEAALAMGCDAVGGLDPAGIDGAIDAHLDIVFGLAEKHGKPIDIHLHDGGELGAFELEVIAARTRALGIEGMVAVSHAFCLGHLAPDRLAHVIAALARADVAIMTNGPGPEIIPPIKQLIAGGVRVFVGSDNIRDAWSPYGNGDMLERARLVGYRAALLTDAELRLAYDLISAAPAKAIGRAPGAIVAGAVADLIVVPAAHVPEAVAAAPPRSLVIKAGRIVARDGVLV